MITAVIPNYNGAGRLAKLLPQLRGLTETIVVDNGSTDGSRDVRDARVIALDRNHGFARAVNEGIRAAKSEWIAILNNDVSLAEGFFEKLVEGAGDAWFAAPKLLMAADAGRIDGAYDLPSRSGAAYRAGGGSPADAPAFNEPCAIACAPMTAALFRRELFDRIGLLDETFGSYLEDVDFGIRCALAGCRGRYVPAAVAYHEGSATLGGAWSSRSTYWISRNQVLLARKYGAPFWPCIAGQGLWGLLAARHGVLGAWIEGKLAGLKLHCEYSRHQDGNAVVLDSERRIAELQSGAPLGGDWFWRWYFRLCPTPPERERRQWTS